MRITSVSLLYRHSILLLSPSLAYPHFVHIVGLKVLYIYVYRMLYIYAHAEYFPIFGQFNHIRPSIFPVVETFQPVTKIEDMVVTHFEITNEIVPSYSCPFHSQDSIYIYVLPCFPDSNLLLFVGTLWLFNIAMENHHF